MKEARPYRLDERGRWLIVSFPEPWSILSWAVVNGGFTQSSRAAWLYLERDEIRDVADPAEWMRARMHAEGIAGAIGFMTSRRKLAWVEASANESSGRAWAIGTVGMSNALRAGDPPAASLNHGTINLFVTYSAPLSTEAALEALCLVSEAKATAVLESRVPSTRSDEAASGTGTDYLAIAWPTIGERVRYAGKHTAAGSVIARAALNAVREGVRQWKEEFGSPA
ncbi:MAG: adenosylcobinamide amidohydrolase [Bryobacteraceae bacterium]